MLFWKLVKYSKIYTNIKRHWALNCVWWRIINSSKLFENLITLGKLGKINSISIGGCLIEVTTIHQRLYRFTILKLNKYLNMEQFANFIVTSFMLHRLLYMFELIKTLGKSIKRDYQAQLDQQILNLTNDSKNHIAKSLCRKFDELKIGVSFRAKSISMLQKQLCIHHLEWTIAFALSTLPWCTHLKDACMSFDKKTIISSLSIQKLNRSNYKVINAI